MRHEVALECGFGQDIDLTCVCSLLCPVKTLANRDRGLIARERFRGK